MSFGLKNVGATYQMLVNKMFYKRPRKAIEIYVDDMLVKDKKAENHTADLAKVFVTPKEYRMKPKSNKCAFEINSGKVLGYVVTRRRIEVHSRP